MSQILQNINTIEDLKALKQPDLTLLAREIREFIIKNISMTGGHLASNLGVVELTIALHRVFESPKDKIVWDVGHQAYVHKILTGRKERFHTLRQYKGLSGFPKKSESQHDIFETGHSSTSISAALGLALARDVKKKKNHVVSVIGDGAMTAGMAFEALNHAGDIGTNLIVILNDNEMSISKNVGGLSQYLGRIRTAPTYARMKDDVENLLMSIPSIGKKVFDTAERAKDSLKYFLVPGVLFEELGFTYLGPVDGHNIAQMIRVLEQAKKVKGPVIIHTITRKGKGYLPAEKNPDQFHGSAPFKIDTGEPKSKSTGEKYSNVLGDTLVALAQENKDVVAITAAMPAGTGLKGFKSKYPNRFYDVGIAEQHGVTLAAGLASEGLKPFYAVYSTFLQRGYDQILHDICIQNLPVVFAIDRAGLVGSDGETHHGVFDLSYLNHLPNITVMAPRGKKEFVEMIEFASTFDGPLAIRYPRGECCDFISDSKKISLKLGKGEVIQKGEGIAVVAIGKMVCEGYKVIEYFNKQDKNYTLINGRFLKPLDEKLLLDLIESHHTIITLEDNTVVGGFGSAINDVLIKACYQGKVVNIGLPDAFVEHGKVEELYKQYGMDAESINHFIENSLD